jgi:hypothetical protein
VLAVLAVAAGYLRFAPKFFGREETVRPLAPGTRPVSLTREAARVRYTPPPAGEQRVAAAGATAPAQARAATAVAERPAEVERPAAAEGPSKAAASTQTAPAETASEQATAPPSGEPAAQADAVGQAEAEAPEARPTAKTDEEVGAKPKEPQPAAPSKPAASAQPATHGGGGEMDQETFDRVLEEQLGRGVDRRVAEGRARAAAVVAARKKAQG